MQFQLLITAALALPLLASSALAAPDVSVRPSTDYAENDCGLFDTDGLILTVTDHGRPILEKRFCSSYGASKARIVSDGRAHNFLLLEYKVGHGTNAPVDSLTVYELTDRLVERVNLTLSEPMGETSRWTYDYRVTARRPSGLTLRMTLQVDGKPDTGSKLPPPTKIIVVP